MIGGRRLQASAIEGYSSNLPVSPGLLRWHLRMCLLQQMKGNAGLPDWDWEYDLGPDDVGEILSQTDAGERMQEELAARLNPLLA